MSFRAEPYGVFVDDLVTSITGGSTRDTFRFLPELQPFQLAAADAVPETVRVHGLAGDTHTRFRNGIDFDVTAGVIVFRPPVAGVVLPDEGSYFYASYERTPDPQAPPRLTDRNPGSILRTLSESFAREYAVVSRQLEQVYDAAFIETAEGRDLDQLVALVGVTRRTQVFAVGEVVFSRTTPAPGDVTIEAGTRISTNDVPSVTVVTSETRTLRTGQLSVSAPVQAVDAGAAGIAAAGKLTVIHRPILGITAVTNPVATAFRGEAETDEALKRRARWALAGAGASTTGAIVGALTSVEGIKDQDVQVTEDHAGAPGTVTVTVATSDLDNSRARLALERLEKVRPAGVRIFHNLNVQPLAVSDAGAGGGAEDTPPPVVDISGVFAPIKVKAAVTPTSATLGADEKTALVGEVEAAIEGFVAGLGVGQPLVYNRLVAAIIAVDGVQDVILDVFPASAAEPHGRQNITPTSSTKLHVEEPLDVELRGAPIAVDVTVSVEPIGPTALLDRSVALDDIGTEVRAKVTAVVAAAAGTLSPEVLHSQIGSTDRYNVDAINYTVDFVDEGLRVRDENVEVHASSEQVLWVRSVKIVDGSASAGPPSNGNGG
jgi:uncharacterized phage protein gp47/JayE